ncbi:glycerol dehydrogenase [Kushneria sinocarnis]|uniref:Glycerol dehydrogenase n=1 Tax=Kushneria sinocarnis TaxID=595502 RepID=A0A420X0K7_9GAMM|nr:glycerol dehydrogenase [Kushneria sinocarnis]RKR07287.1 glycerol dehydrogenase [Kushneria sinocarnis]
MSVKTMGFPGRYTQGPGALDEIGCLFEELQYHSPLLVTDVAVRDKVRPDTARQLSAIGATPQFIDFPGECTRPVIEELTASALGYRADSIVAFGGGKTIDAAKGTARALDLPIVVCPTTASSDAPTSRLIVLYDEAHRVVDVDYLNRNPAAILVDSELIANAPPRLFAAGIGDALSKRFEARQCQAANGRNSFGTMPSDTALLFTDTVYERLKQYAPEAYASVCRQQWTPAVEAVIETTVLNSGIGFESGGLSLAHALIRGMTAIPAMADMLHGELVAFGTLVEVLVEKQPETVISELLSLMEAVNLPMTLAEMGQIDSLDQIQLETMAEATLATGYSRNMNPPLREGTLVAAVLEADERGTQWRLGR